MPQKDHKRGRERWRERKGRGGGGGTRMVKGVSDSGADDG